MVEFRSVVEAITLVATILGICEHHRRQGKPTRCEEDRHHFRFTVSPEEAGQMADLRAFTRELMADAERDLGAKLDWAAVDHWNTDNPHIHVLVRGRARRGA